MTTSRGIPLPLTVFVVGTASLGAEIAAARLLAPWFGASTIVWANTIATVLVALSIGYALGGRLADRDPTPSGLARVVFLSGILLAAVPYVADPFLRLSTSAFDSLSIGTFLGSLIGVCVLVAAPLVLLGMVSPYAVRLAVDRVEDAGRMAGRLYAISTVGSLVGTFLSALLLIPWAGTRRTFLAFALALVVVAVPGLRARWRVPGLVIPLVIVGLIALPTGALKTTRDDAGRVIWEKETEYQYARVLQKTDGERVLELNEGLAVHSRYTPGQWLTNDYYDDLLGLAWAGERSTPRSVAILGNAAGTTARALGHFSPTTRVDGVEIDPALTEVGKELFDLRGPDLHLYADDARPWLRRNTQPQDAILVDAYRQPYIPFYLTTVEFFELVRDRLTPGGVVVVNVGHPEGSPDLEKALAATMRAVFGDDRVFRDPCEPTNTMLVATTSGADPVAALRQHALDVPPDLGRVLDTAAGRLAPALTGGQVFTDDRAPVEWLVDLSLGRLAE